MQQYLDSIQFSLETDNHFAAIAMALTLPDICASIEAKNNETSRFKYCAWFDKYLADIYTLDFGDAGIKVVFSSKECYAARCSFLHQGTHITQHQKVLNGVSRGAESVSFMFNTGHRDFTRNEKGFFRNGDKLLLDVDMFCLHMIRAVEKWMLDVKNDKAICKKIKALPIVSKGLESLYVQVPISK